MKIGVSNLSWTDLDKAKNTEAVEESGYDYIESAYAKMSTDYPILAIQSIFYGSDIGAFLDDDVFLYMEQVVNDCRNLGVETITFGSPSMRVGNKSNMLRFLTDMDFLLEGTGIKLCVEPNASYYGATYYNTLESIVQDLVSYKNISSMIDVGNSFLEGQDCFAEYEKYNKFVSHVHFSTPGLEEIKDFGLYRDFYQELQNSGYRGKLTYEFAKAEDTETAIRAFCQNLTRSQ
jgi:sugar phosphate isomerase/epimerase